MKSYLDRTAQFVSTDGSTVELLSSGIVRAVESEHCVTPAEAIDGHPISVSIFSPFVSVEGLPEDDSEDILVPAIVVSAMRSLGIKRRGRTFTPGMLRERAGLILHQDLLAK